MLFAFVILYEVRASASALLLSMPLHYPLKAGLAALKQNVKHSTFAIKDVKCALALSLYALTSRS